MEIDRESYDYACADIETEIAKLSSELMQLDDLLYPYKDTHFKVPPVMLGFMLDPELIRMGDIRKLILKQADTVRALRLSCEKLRKA
jgi:hypothetical protein